MTQVSKVDQTPVNYREVRTYWDRNFGASPPTENQSLSYLEDSTLFQGDDRPNWRQVIGSRGNATNPAFGQRTTSKLSSGSTSSTHTRIASAVADDGSLYDVLDAVETCQASGQFVFVGLPGSTISAGEADDMAKAKFVSNARSRMSPAQGGVILGEIRETLHMLRHPADSLRRSLSSYLADVKKQSRGLSKASTKRKNAAVSGTWLEYTFGWAPLLYDIRDSAKAISQLASRTPPNEKISSSAKFDAPVDESPGSGGAGDCTFDFSIVTIDRTKAAYYGAINTSIDPVPSLGSAFGLRPHDFLPTIWELIPYSFVADYFTNIGNIISCASFCERYLAWWGASTVSKRVATATNFQNTTLDTGPYYDHLSGSINPGSMTRTREEFHRYVSPALVPSLRFRIPGSPRVGFNLAALFAQSRNIGI